MHIKMRCIILIKCQAVEPITDSMSEVLEQLIGQINRLHRERSAQST